MSTAVNTTTPLCSERLYWHLRRLHLCAKTLWVLISTIFKSRIKTYINFRVCSIWDRKFKGMWGRLAAESQANHCATLPSTNEQYRLQVLHMHQTLLMYHLCSQSISMIMSWEWYQWTELDFLMMSAKVLYFYNKFVLSY